jgi:putative endopeptidase
MRPQDNFYQYVNKDWIEKTNIPRDRVSESDSNKLIDKNRQRILRLIKDKKKSLPHKLFKLGMKEHNNNGLLPFIQKINSIQNKKDVMMTIAYFNLYGITSPLSIQVSIDSHNSTKYCCYLDPSGCFLPTKDYYVKEKAIVEKYIVVINKVMNYFFKNKKNTIFYVEKKLAKEHLSPEDLHDIDKVTNYVSFKELTKQYPNLFFEEMFHLINIHTNKKIIVSSLKYLKHLNTLINQIDLESWKMYLLWCLITSTSDSIDERIEKMLFEFTKTLYGQKEMREKKYRIYSIVSSFFSGLLGKYFVEKYFNKKIESDVNDMISDIKKESIKYVENVEWMTNKTKKEAIKKLKGIKSKIGYPKKIETFKNLSITTAMETNFTTFILELSKFLNCKMVNEYNKNKNVKRDIWFMPAYAVNAYYSSSFNEIVFPAGILQCPFYDLKQSYAKNLAFTGIIIGHEIVHSLDNNGRKFDSKGNKRDWWTTKDESMYNKMSTKLIKQYNNYNILGKSLNGKLCFGENFADYLGFVFCYRIFLKTKPSNEEKKIFFRYFAELWRSKYTPETIQNRLNTDPHSPEEFRVNGVLSLIDDFYEVYNVKPGDKMYLDPSKRTKI